MSNHRQCYACHVPSESKPDKPVKAKDVLDIRIVPGNKNAWIECYENTYDEDAVVGNAEYNAQIENARLQEHLQKKEDKLKSFQEEVKRRVSHLQRLKREEEQRRCLKMVEDEHNLVLQRTLGIRIPYQGTAEELQTLNKELLKSCIIPCNNDKQLQFIASEVEKSDQKIEEIAQEIKLENLKARSKLLSKKLEKYETELPGGIWRSPSLKQSSSDDSGSIGDEEVDDEKPPLDTALNDSDVWLGENAIKSTYAPAVKRDMEVLPTQSEKVCELKQKLQISPCYEEPPLQNKLNYIYEFGKDEEVEKIQKQNQYWKFRKLFMEIERDQVKENKKLRDHRKRVQNLKLVKEQERKIAEKKITRFPEKPIETNKEETPEQRKTDFIDQKMLLHEKEMYRYMEALRKVARERIKVCNITIPPLCSCGPSFWDSHPDKCANNCIFYKNIKVYVAALTSALANTR